MKKLIISVLSLILLLGFYTPKADAAAVGDYCEQYRGVTKIWWNGVELKYGQIGRLTIVKNTSLYKLNGSTKVFSRTLKTGEKYRIYAFKPGMLSVGGGLYVDRNEKVKYETPSKTKLDAVYCINVVLKTSQPPVPPATLSNVYIYSDDGDYLGLLTSNVYDSESVFNEYGQYGSKYSSTSIWNQYSTYGSKYSSESAFNPYTSTPPLIIDSHGNLLGKVTVNKYVSGAINPYDLNDFAKYLGL
ncbi:hypothetical protein V7157_10450 [Neobacillus drentensis]|uniref:hypothetical protein n=1 Tax=Neobacillus drentensis TaxID=220684 RepID=UPI003000A7FB